MLQNSFVKSFLEAIEFPAFLVSENFIVEEINNRISTLLSLERDNIIGEKCYRLFHKTDYPLKACPVLLTPKETGPSIFRVEMETPSEKRVFKVSSKLLKTEDQEGKRYILNILVDTTEEYRKELIYRDIFFEKSAAGAYIVTPDGRFIDANPKLLEILGYNSLEELKKLNIKEDLYLVPHERDRFVEKMEKEGKVEDYQVWLKRKNGEPVCISVYGKVEKDPNGKTQFYHGTVVDITEKVNIERKLKEFKSELIRFIRNVPLGFFRFTADGELTFVNPYMVKVLEKKPSEILGGNIKDLLFDKLDEEHKKTIVSKLDKHGSITGDEVRMLVEGKSKWIRLHIYPLERENGKLVFEGICRDITKEKSLRDQVYFSQKMEALGQLAGGIAHEFNNILMVILGTLELSMLEINREEPLYKRLEAAKKVAERGSALTKKLLSFTRERPGLPKVVDINSIIKDLIYMLKGIMEESVKIEVHLCEEPLMVKIDPIQFEHAILNLAVNAKDAMPKGGVFSIKTKRIVINGKPRASVIVSDTGRGMDEETLSKIFEPFFTTKEHGSGLGLSVVYGTVKQHGGTITCESEPSKGTTFKMTFPMEEEKEESVGGSEKTYTRKSSILVVEDDADVREVTCAILESCGYEVAGASSGKEALDTMRKGFAADIILTDEVMPGMSGKELSEKVRAEYPETKIVLMSGYLKDVDRVPETVDAFIRKPFSKSELLKTVKEVLKSKGSA